MTLRNVLLTAHILIALMTLGWLITTELVAPVAIRRGDLPVLRFIGSIAPKLGPAAGVVFLLGIWLVLRAEDGIEFKDKWVSWSMLLFIVAMMNGSAFIGKTMRAAGQKIAGGQDAAAEASRVTLLAGINLVLLTTIVYLMVAKPGGY